MVALVWSDHRARTTLVRALAEVATLSFGALLGAVLAVSVQSVSTAAGFAVVTDSLYADGEAGAGPDDSRQTPV